MRAKSLRGFLFDCILNRIPYSFYSTYNFYINPIHANDFNLYCYDDYNIKTPNRLIKKKIIEKIEINKISFDYIVISPGIDLKKCILKNYLKKNKKKIITELDIFYLENKKNFKITITGTNGKSTTSKLLYEVLKNNKKDVRLTGNIGYPIVNIGYPIASSASTLCIADIN